MRVNRGTSLHTRGVDINDVGYLYVLIYKKGNKNTWIKVGKTTNPKERLSQYNSNTPVALYDNYHYLSEKIFNLSNAELMLIEYMRNLDGATIEGTKKEWFKIRVTRHFVGTTPRPVQKAVCFIEHLTNLYFECD